MANIKAAMEYAQTFEREAMKKRLSESDLEAPTLIDVVVRHEQQIQELKRLITPMMEFKQEQPTTMGMEYAANFEKAEKLLEKKEWVGLTDEELLDAYGWKEKVEKNRFWEDTHPILEKARQDMLVGLRKVEAKLKEKNRSL